MGGGGGGGGRGDGTITMKRCLVSAFVDGGHNAIAAAASTETRTQVACRLCCRMSPKVARTVGKLVASAFRIVFGGTARCEPGGSVVGFSGSRC
jgi:hypothetical protein